MMPERAFRAIEAVGAAIVALHCGDQLPALILEPGPGDHDPAAHVRELELAPGVSAKVRAADERLTAQIIRAADVNGEDLEAGRRATETIIRWSIIDAHGLRLFDEPLAFSTEDHPDLGPIASLEVFDAVLELEGAEGAILKLFTQAQAGVLRLDHLTRDPGALATTDADWRDAAEFEASMLSQSHWNHTMALAQALLEERALTAGEVAAVLAAAEADQDWRKALRDHRAGQSFG